MTIEEFLGTDIRFDSDFVKEDDPEGDITTISGLDNYKAAMLRRWTTTPGSLAHRPEYGAGLKDYQNAPNTLATRQKITQRIEEQALRDNRTEAVLSVSFTWDDLYPEKTIISVSMKVRGYGDVEITFNPF